MGGHCAGPDGISDCDALHSPKRNLAAAAPIQSQCRCENRSFLPFRHTRYVWCRTEVPLSTLALKCRAASPFDPAPWGRDEENGRKHQVFIVQCKVAAAASERPIPPPSAWRIPPVEDTIESVANDLLEGEYNNPVRVIGFDAAQGTSRDVSEDVARELRRRCADQRREPPEFLQEFLGQCESGPSLSRP